MPELPEIYILAGQMNKELEGKKIVEAEVRQEKCLNMPADEFVALVKGRAIGNIRPRGKWIITALEPEAYFLLSLGMGGDVRYHKPGEAAQEKYQLKLGFDDRSSLSIAFWWFGYAHATTAEGLQSHKMTSSLGPSPLDDKTFTREYFAGLLKGSRKTIKSLLTDQKLIAGIGNVYVQDTLFRARLHPNRKALELSETDIEALYSAIRVNLKEAIALGGTPERDLYGRPGRLGQDKFLVGYKEGQPCPECGAIIEKIKTGRTSSYVCPRCQR
ncbi:MAG TPA: DNA-formamidopyrimidine glycosylase family protein [Methanocella sp.]|jgi:formamidopyrimidine-DNA glycosylase